MHLPVPTHVENAAQHHRYNTRVFSAPPWREIFTQDAERTQTFDEAVRTYESLAQTYRTEGYELVTLPLVSIAERAEFLLSRIG